MAHPRILFIVAAAVSLVAAIQETVGAFQGPAGQRRQPGVAARPGEEKPGTDESRPLDPRGRMEDHPTDKPARYYLWHDQHGWHLRSCSRLVNKFEGTVRVEGGTLRKCRPIGIDPKGRGADKWGLNKDRNELKFELHTAQSFDGFDFTADETKATLEFELLINGKPMPARIFVGRNGEHPREARFAFPADPEKIGAGDGNDKIRSPNVERSPKPE